MTLSKRQWYVILGVCVLVNARMGYVNFMNGDWWLLFLPLHVIAIAVCCYAIYRTWRSPNRWYEKQ